MDLIALGEGIVVCCVPWKLSVIGRWIKLANGWRKRDGKIG